MIYHSLVLRAFRYLRCRQSDSVCFYYIFILSLSLSLSNLQTTTERLRQFQMNGGPQHSFEETIHRVSRMQPNQKLSSPPYIEWRHTCKSNHFPFSIVFRASSNEWTKNQQLKVQEAIRKKEKFQREHEEVRYSLSQSCDWMNQIEPFSIEYAFY